MIGPSVWGLSEIVQSEKGPTVIGPSVIGQSEILAQTDGPQRPWAQIVLGQNEIQANNGPLSILKKIKLLSRNWTYNFKKDRNSIFYDKLLNF